MCQTGLHGKIIARTGENRWYSISNLYSILSNCLGVIIQSHISPLIMVTNSVFSTEAIQMNMEQQLYDSKYRASMGSIKSIVKNILFSIFALFLGKLADIIGVIYAIIILQLLKFIPIIIYNDILNNMKLIKVLKD